LRAKLTTARDFFRSITGFSAVFSVTTLVMIAGYLFALLQLSRAEWTGFLQIVGVLFPFMFLGTTFLNQRILAKVMTCLQAEEAGGATPVEVRAGFSTLANLPYTMFLSGVFWWSGGGAIVATGMLLRFEEFSGFQASVMTLAAATGGFVSSVFMFFVVKHRFAELRCELASRIDEPTERERLVNPIGVGKKLVVSVTGVTFLTVIFALFLSLVHASGQLEAYAVDVQGRFLEAHLSELQNADSTSFAAIEKEAVELGIAAGLLLLDREKGDVLAGDESLLLLAERKEIEFEAGWGDSLSLHSSHAFAWRALPGGRSVVVAVQPWSAISGDSGGVWIRFTITLLLAGLLAFTLSRHLARDIGETTQELGARADRVAEGDLRGSGGVFESEDELGSLSRSFERMASALRETVQRVVGAADGVEATATETAIVAEGVSSAARAQAQGVKETVRSMEGVTQQASDISSAAQNLGAVVEESSSAILQLGATGEQLAETASVLFTKVEEVSNSIEESVRRTREVGANTVSLAETSEGTAASMLEMASAMREVSTAAEASKDLSNRVVNTAERGRATVRQTVDSMRSIRQGIDSAENVIRGLGIRAQKIGSVVDVIDAVADETNLLALNAAIIAAQAGEGGKAFSVVAKQIKELADRVLSSTKEIGDLIRSVQAESMNAIEAITAGSESVSAGVALSTDAGDALEEITRVARESGDRISQIVVAVKEQTQASGYVAELMESVRERVESIHQASYEQDRGNDVILRSVVSMRDIAQQLQTTTGEQARGSLRISESIEGVRSATKAINDALLAQSRGCKDVAVFLEEVAGRSHRNDELAELLDGVTKQLLDQANKLREDVDRFLL